MASWNNSTTASQYQGFIASELNDAISGPFKYPRFLATTNVQDSSILVGLDTDKNILHADLEQLRDDKFTDPGSDPITSLEVLPTSDEFVVASVDGKFAYYGRNIASPFAESVVGDLAINPCLYFENSYLSIAETGPMHLSSEHEIKQLHEVVVSFKTNSVGHLWCYAENEDGDVSGQYKGSIYGKHRIKVFLNLRGREFRVRIFIATHVNYPWQIQEVALGHLMGKALT